MSAKTIFRLNQRPTAKARKPLATSPVGTALLREQRLPHRRLGGAESALRQGVLRNPSIASIVAKSLAGRPAQLYRGGA